MRVTPSMRTAACTAPYLAWMALMAVLPQGAGPYAARSFCTAVLLAASLAVFRPGRKGLACAPAWGVAAGLAVFALWTWPEGFEWYRRWFVAGRGAGAGASPYDPAVCGWPLTLVRLAGSAFVIAVAEEMFFRHFLYRRLQSREWADVPHGTFDTGAFLWTTALFALEHDRWLAGAAAGAVSGLVYVTKGLGAAALAHVVTNLALGLHVIRHGLWTFW